MKTFGVCRQTSPDRPGFDRLVRLDEAETLLPAADFVPGRDAAVAGDGRVAQRERLALVPQDAVVVNVGRGSFLLMPMRWHGAAERPPVRRRP